MDTVLLLYTKVMSGVGIHSLGFRDQFWLFRV